MGRTQRLDVVLIETSLHVFDHEAGLPYLRVANHPHFDDDAAVAIYDELHTKRRVA